MNSEFNTANFLPKIYVDNQVNDTCNVKNIYGKSWVNSNNIEYINNNINLSTYSRACSCPNALCLCDITVRYGYPCSIEDIQVYICNSFKHQTHHTSIGSFDIFQDCKVYIETGLHLKLSGEIHSTDSDKVKNNSKFILVNGCNNAGCSADDTYLFTNTSFTCSVKQAAYMCQVGARNVNTQLGILDYASQICTNMTLYGGVCRDASRILLENYRLVFNLSFISKLIEKLVAKQLNSYINSEGFSNVNQSGYKRLHSTDTAHSKIQNDIAASLDSGKAKLGKVKLGNSFSDAFLLSYEVPQGPFYALNYSP